jgi:hypothetical protein
MISGEQTFPEIRQHKRLPYGEMASPKLSLLPLHTWPQTRHPSSPVRISRWMVES